MHMCVCCVGLSPERFPNFLFVTPLWTILSYLMSWLMCVCVCVCTNLDTMVIFCWLHPLSCEGGVVYFPSAKAPPECY